MVTHVQGKAYIGFIHTEGSAVSPISGIYRGLGTAPPQLREHCCIFQRNKWGPSEVKNLCRGPTACLGWLCPEALTSTLQASPIIPADRSLHLIYGCGCESLTALMSRAAELTGGQGVEAAGLLVGSESPRSARAGPHRLSPSAVSLCCTAEPGLSDGNCDLQALGQNQLSGEENSHSR